MKNSADDFIQGLKKSRETYVECPHCRMIFSLFGAKMMSGKNPPKDILAKSQKQVMKAYKKLTDLQNDYDLDIEDLREQKNSLN